VHRSKSGPPMSASGQKQTSRPAWTLSALPPKADIERHDWHVCLVPKADSCTATSDLRGFSIISAGPRFRLTDVTEYFARVVRITRP
jgi:hypothetical protein